MSERPSARPPPRSRRPPSSGTSKSARRRLSIVSNSALIVLKIVAGAVTGSIAIITEAVHSSIDLLASIVAYFSVRKADEPADEAHMYGHAKVENLAAAIEGMLILVGAGVIVFEAVRRLANGADEVDALGFGIAVIGVSDGGQPRRVHATSTGRRERTTRRRWRATPPTCAPMR